MPRVAQLRVPLPCLLPSSCPHPAPFCARPFPTNRGTTPLPCHHLPPCCLLQVSEEESLRKMTAGMTASDAIKRMLLAYKDRDYFRCAEGRPLQAGQLAGMDAP